MISRLRRFFSFVLAGWRLSASEIEPQPPQDNQAFDFERDSYLFNLMASPGLPAVLGAISEQEERKLLQHMRSQVQSVGVNPGWEPEAIRAEAAAQVFDDLPQVFQRYAKRYTPPEGER